MAYWEQRKKQLYNALESDEKKVKKRISKVIDSEQHRIQNEIAAFYQKYGRANVIEYKWLRENLPQADLDLLMQDMNAFAAKYPQYAHLLPTRMAIYKLDRLEGLQTSMKLKMYDMAAQEEGIVRGHLDKQAIRFANGAYQELGFGDEFYFVDDATLRLFVDTPWSNGQNFSQRIWGNTNKLAQYMNTDIAQGFARGDNYRTLTNQLMQRFGNVSRRDAYRLIYTEGTFIAAEASSLPFRNEGFETYQIVTAGDAKVCDICLGLEGKDFDFSVREPGINFPPLHPWCRCTIKVTTPNDADWIEQYARRHGESAETRARAKEILKNVKF